MYVLACIGGYKEGFGDTVQKLIQHGHIAQAMEIKSVY